MSRRVIWLLLFSFALVRGNSGKPADPANEWLSTYLRADKFFNSAEPTESTDSIALAGFEKVIRLLTTTGSRQKDSILFESQLKKGILLAVQDQTILSKEAYLQAAAVHRRSGSLSDSVLFRLFVYVGSSYYTLNNFDSANHYLIKAEALGRKFPGVTEKERLFNNLGALHFANGNYYLSKNYFEKALDLVKSTKPFDAAFARGLQSNIASANYKAGKYPEALTIYREIIGDNSADYIYYSICMNMGKAYQALGKYPEALSSFRRIDPNESPGVFNEIAAAHFELGNYDSTAYYLGRLEAMQKTKELNILDEGIYALYKSDLLIQKQQYPEAIKDLQLAICAFSSNFRNTDIYSNPINFSGSYTYFRLYEALQKKAQAFYLLYRNSTNEKYLTGALDSYMSALQLIGYIEKSYDTDDAKLFLKQNSGDVYASALEVCLELNELHPGNKYLDQAFRISEMNKASILASGLHQRKIANYPGADSSLLQTERNIRYNIARLDVQSQQASGNDELEKLAKEKAGYEIALSQLQKNLEQDNQYFRRKYDHSVHGADELQKALTRNQALFNFVKTKRGPGIFALTRKEFKYIELSGGESLQDAAADWIHLLQSTGDGRKFNGKQTGGYLYSHLVKPMLEFGSRQDEWIIIADGNLQQLPFESLPADESGKYLLESKTISYQFSTRFILTGQQVINEAYKVLSFAPFASPGTRMEQLPASKEETEGLAGKIYLNEQATKQDFLREASQYPVVHLATHAIAETENPAASYIAFYPKQDSPAEDNLFLEEIYNLALDKCQLVIISACETGKGEIVSNEGVISLGRAFAYAGCGGTLSSLWKAEDRSTAAILKAFHKYLQKGYTTAAALRQAKLDYLHSDALYKNPAFWSHLVFTGNPQAVTAEASSVVPWMMLLLVVVLLILLRETKLKKSRRNLQMS
ncbi:CHAT domain-containing protein [Flavihumibacter solisilvae]|uniref:CHAT domain-containing protein n=1 Tax=Flavihumibacter solisilvae TaxID=1349421 RepID=A0A0C1IZ66_9BACT|nr:CHAT domain-containing tetratricopeptide repeat protein [Flavihumibacter solisilvae]KIC95794.1 hypothetical protein OI18_03925 [Flavihumibacter solisilvae]